MLKSLRAKRRNIVILDGHPHRQPDHFLHALARAYATGANAEGHSVRWIKLADLTVPLLNSLQDWEDEDLPEHLRGAQQAIEWAQHLAIFFPLWLGDMPAALKALLEQLLRPGFAFHSAGGTRWTKGLSGRSARIVVTMGMPAFVYRFYYGALGTRLLRRNILNFVGISPVRTTLIGNVEGSTKRNAAQLRAMVAIGGRAN
jgi:putative NADPH-quinone reductase